MRYAVLLIGASACAACDHTAERAQAADATVSAPPVAPTAANASEAGPAAPLTRVEVSGSSAKIRHDAVLGGALAGYRLRITQIDLLPGGFVGAHNHLGPGIRLMTVGRMEYVLPTWRTIYGPGEVFFETGDVSHRALNLGEAPSQHLLFEVLPAGAVGTSIVAARERGRVPDAHAAAAERAIAAPRPPRAITTARSHDATERLLHEAVVAGLLTELAGKYVLRLTQVDVGPDGSVGAALAPGPRIRLVTSGSVVLRSATDVTTLHAGGTHFDAGERAYELASEGGAMSEHLVFEIVARRPGDAP